MPCMVTCALSISKLSSYLLCPSTVIRHSLIAFSQFTFLSHVLRYYLTPLHLSHAFSSPSLTFLLTSFHQFIPFLSWPSILLFTNYFSIILSSSCPQSTIGHCPIPVIYRNRTLSHTCNLSQSDTVPRL
jgi:hypothetical protein